MLSNITLCQAQLFKGFGKKLEKKVEKRIEGKADRHVDKVLDKADKKTDEPIADALHNKKAKTHEEKNVKVENNEKINKSQKGETKNLLDYEENSTGEIGKKYDVKRKRDGRGKSETT